VGLYDGLASTSQLLAQPLFLCLERLDFFTGFKGFVNPLAAFLA
jgi:hypothetical protein